MTEQKPPRRATLRWPGTRRERRIAVLLPLGAALLVGGTLGLIGGFGDGEGRGGEQTSEVEAEIESTRARLTRSLDDKRYGIGATWPKSWRRTNLEGEHVLESRDRCMAIRLSAPVAADRADRLRRETLGALRRDFKAIQIARGEQGKRIGGIPVSEDVITVPNKRGGAVRILLSVGRGAELAYLTEVLLRDPACSRTLLEAQLILESARFSR